VFERIDLHTHSRYSDGTLTPAELCALAAEREVQLLALTDHDTLAGCDEAERCCQDTRVRFLAGVELTTQWRETEVHVIGLRLDRLNAALGKHVTAVQHLRRERIRQIGARLDRKELDGTAMAEAALHQAVAPTRMHLARLLVAGGHVKDPQQAFDQWLGRGRPGFVPSLWPSIEQAAGIISAAGGLAVLAHPHRYRLSNGALRELCGAFKSAGGAGIEVSVAGMSPDEATRAATLARRFDLAGSVGSDFHEPGLPWRPVGRFAKLPDAVVSITERLGLDAAIS
jgi:3',5'-nucleoside bisphosphate phosphatase